MSSESCYWFSKGKQGPSGPSGPAVSMTTLKQLFIEEITLTLTLRPGFEVILKSH